ncbi:MAG: beta-L-arabinofuranosidase domain-containing protein [Terracidiphilus sp.]
MDRRRFMAQAAGVALVAHEALMPARGDASSQAASGSAESSSEPGLNVGPDASRYRLTRDRVLKGTGPAYTPEFLLADVQGIPERRFTNFCGDTSGRWIGALSACSRSFGEEFPLLHDVVKRTIALQHEDGYFGGMFHYEQPNDDDLALLWGNGRLLVGLMEYYALDRDAAVLGAARKLGDFLLRIAPQFNSQAMADAFSAEHYASSYICWTQQTEGLAALYAATRDERYRELCAEISKRISRRPGDHVHGHLTSLRGTLDLYEATGDAACLKQLTAAWQDVVHSGDVLITGGVPERWSPKRERTEGCAECDWLRLNLGLYRATGEAMYMDRAQETYFNEFSMNQFATGDFGHGNLDAAGRTVNVNVRAWWCCTLHGLRTFPALRDSAFRVAGDEAFFDFPIDSGVRSQGFAAEARSDLAWSGEVRIEVRAAGKGQRLTVFKPSWADRVTLTRNGGTVSGLTIDGIAAGDAVSVKYGMSLHASELGGTARKLRFGPWLLGISSSANPTYFGELQAQNVFDVATFRPDQRSAQQVFEVPAARGRMRYRSAEYPDQPAEVELVAVAEQTANPPETWQLVVPVGPAAG